MKHLYSLALVIMALTWAISTSAQEETSQPVYSLKALTPQEELQLMNLPELK